MKTHPCTRRGALSLALGGMSAWVGATACGAGADGPTFRRLGVAFGTTVSIKLEARDAPAAEAAFAGAFAQIRHIEKVASLVDPEGDLYRLNRDGRLRDPDPALIEMLRMAETMGAATDGAFDVTVQPLWLALDAAAKRGRWLDAEETREALSLVDQRRLRFDNSWVEFETPGMQATLNSLARGLAADRVAAALARAGVTRAFFDTDVLGARGARADGAPWRARIRHPRDAAASVADVAVDGCLATSGDYQYFWSPDYSRHHILDARKGASPAMWSSVSVLAPTGLLADALSTAAFLVDDAAPSFVRGFGAEAMFVDKRGAASATPGFPMLS